MWGHTSHWLCQLVPLPSVFSQTKGPENISLLPSYTGLSQSPRHAPSCFSTSNKECHQSQWQQWWHYLQSPALSKSAQECQHLCPKECLNSTRGEGPEGWRPTETGHISTLMAPSTAEVALGGHYTSVSICLTIPRACGK